jgi:hypothetical protein
MESGIDGCPPSRTIIFITQECRNSGEKTDFPVNNSYRINTNEKTSLFNVGSLFDHKSDSKLKRSQLDHLSTK